jgi:hypothetical protein
MEDADQTQPKCPRCGAAMKETNSIAPFGAEPGLRIFECPGCGSATSYIEASTPSTKGSAFPGEGAPRRKQTRKA